MGRCSRFGKKMMARAMQPSLFDKFGGAFDGCFRVGPFFFEFTVTAARGDQVGKPPSKKGLEKTFKKYALSG